MARWNGRKRRCSTSSTRRVLRLTATTTLESATLADELEDWLQDYNYQRVHGSLGVTPIDRWAALQDELPSWDDVIAAFDLTTEMNYVELLTLRRQYAAARKK
jgi:transposase InsO family protein